MSTHILLKATSSRTDTLLASHLSWVALTTTPPPNNPIHASKERRHSSWPQSVKYIEGYKGTTWRHFRSAETTCSIHTQALFLETMSVSSQIHLCFEHDALFFFTSTVYYSTVSPRVNKYSGCLQSNYRLIEMCNKVNYFTTRSTFALTARCFSFVFVPCCSGGWGGLTFPIYSLFTCFVTNRLPNIMKNNSLFKKLNCN